MIWQFIVTFFRSFKKPVQEMEHIPLTPKIPLPINPEPVLTPSERLYLLAKACLGMEASPNDIAPDEFGCMETVDDIYKKAFGTYINGTKDLVTLSTTVGYKIFTSSPRFKEVMLPTIGNIIISPTGYGNGTLANGHVGIVAKYGILSNDSTTGLFMENYTLETWIARYKTKGGFPVKFFKPI